MKHDVLVGGAAAWLLLCAWGCAGREFEFKHAFVDTDLGQAGWAAVAVADFDGDGRPELASGCSDCVSYSMFDRRGYGWWERKTLIEGFSPNVGAAATDFDGDGRMELVCGEWGPRLFWVARRSGTEEWKEHEVYSGLRDPHDLLAMDIDGDGRDEIIAREKGGRLLLFRMGADAKEGWEAQTLAEGLSGDGMAIAHLSGKGPDIVTNQGWFENADGSGRRWIRHPFVPAELEWDAESRVAVGDLDGDGRGEAVITESEKGPARLAILEYVGSERPWRAKVILKRNLDLRALHSLKIADFNGDGRPEIFTAEMENNKTDGVTSKPKWIILSRTGWGWKVNVILDENLGTHEAATGDFDGDGDIDIVGKVWKSNQVNGCGGCTHADFMENRLIE